MKHPSPLENATGLKQERPKAVGTPGHTQNAQHDMSKTLEVINETIKDPNHPFPKLDHQPKKPLKNRYERRKIKEILHLLDWQTEEAV